MTDKEKMPSRYSLHHELDHTSRNDFYLYAAIAGTRSFSQITSPTL